MTPLETITFDLGLSARIYHDADVEQPFRFDKAVRIVILHRHYLDPSGGECGCDHDDLAAWEHENVDEWFTIPLFLYDHSGVIYRVGEQPVPLPVGFGPCRYDRAQARRLGAAA